MKKTPPLGLLAAGPVSRNGVARLPAVRNKLGPVKAPSFRVARRMVNTWRSGYAVREYQELENSRVLLIDVPADELEQTVNDLVQSAWDWHARTVLLWSGERDSSALAALAALGAETGSVHVVPGFEGKRLTAEGSRAAVREVKRLFVKDGWRVMELEAGRKPLYRAGLSFVDLLPISLLQASVDTLMDAGLSYVEAVDIGVAQMQRALRSYVSTGRRAWPAAAAMEGEAADQLAAYRPKLAEFYRTSLEHGISVFRRGEIEGQNPQ